MKHTMILLTIPLLLSGGVAFADEECAVPMKNWQPREAISRLAASKGWTVRRIKIDDGCYEVVGTDANGRKIEVKIHPGTLAVVQSEHQDEKDEDDDSRKKHSDD